MIHGDRNNSPQPASRRAIGESLVARPAFRGRENCASIFMVVSLLMDGAVWWGSDLHTAPGMPGLDPRRLLTTSWRRSLAGRLCTFRSLCPGPDPACFSSE